MNWRKRRKREQDKFRRMQERGRDTWPIDSQFKTSDIVRLSAPAIEAAGSIDQACRLGMIAGTFGGLQMLADHVPKSRGGTLDHSRAEEEWQNLVDAEVRYRCIDMTAMRNLCKSATNP